MQVAEFRDARYYQPSLAVIDAQDRLAYDYTQVWQNARLNNQAFETFRLPKAQRLQGTSLLLDCPAHGHNYFHWLIEGFPRLAAAQAAGYSLDRIDRFLLSGPLAAYQAETLRKIGIPADKIFDCSTVKHVSCERLIAPTNAREHLYETARAFLQSIWRAPDSRPQRRIYVSRADASVRRVVNETELTITLAELGFETITLSSLTVDEQASLFAQAAVIVAPHGAALANLVFCAAGTQLVEIQFPDYVKGLYWRMAGMLGIHYATCEGVRSPGSSGDAAVSIPEIFAAAKAAVSRSETS